MKKSLVLQTVALLFSSLASAQSTLPLVFGKENTGKAIKKISISPAQLSYNNEALPDPFLYQDGTYNADYKGWERHHNETARMVQDYEIGPIPSFKKVTATYNAAETTINIKVDTKGGSLEFSSKIIIPEGNGPFPVIIGMNMPSGSIRPEFVKGCILVPFKHDQIIKSSHQAVRDSAAAFYKLFPNYKNTSGNYSGWTWGISRLIDALYQVKDQIHADVNHIAVTGCSYAGKMAMFAGAFDERIALTIIQESGGGGINSWRASDYHTATTNVNVERVENTNYSWFAPSFKDNFNGKLNRLPYDHHQIISMIAPRAVLVLGNSDYPWLCDYSGYVSTAAASKVWDKFGISDRFGYVFEGGHPHCMACDSENDAVQRFVEKFLFNKPSDTNIRKADEFKDTDMNRWIGGWK